MLRQMVRVDPIKKKKKGDRRIRRTVEKSESNLGRVKINRTDPENPREYS